MRYLHPLSSHSRDIVSSQSSNNPFVANARQWRRYFSGDIGSIQAQYFCEECVLLLVVENGYDVSDVSNNVFRNELIHKKVWRAVLIQIENSYCGYVSYIKSDGDREGKVSEVGCVGEDGVLWIVGSTLLSVTLGVYVDLG